MRPALQGHNGMAAPPDQDETMANPKREALWLALILVLAALLRVWYLAEVVKAPDFRALRQDMEVQDYQARAMLSGDWTPPPGRNDPEIDRTPYYRPPGYPYYLAVVYRLTGGSYLAPRVLQTALGLVGIALMFLLARRLFGGGAGLLTALLMATHWALIYYEGEVNDPSLFVFLIPCILWAVVLWRTRFDERWAVIAGILIGCYAVMRPNILLFGPFLAAWMLWVARRAGRLPRVPASWTALLCATLAVIAPVTTRNWLVSGEFVPVSTYFGQNLFIGNSAESDGFTPWTPYLQKLEGTGQFSVWVYNNIVRGLGREVGKENLTHSEASSIFARKALDHIRAHPGHALRLTLRKAVLFWSPREITGNKVVEQDRRHYAPLKYLPGFWLTGGLFLAGLLTLGWDRLRGRRCGDPELLALLLVFVLVYYVSFLPFFVNARARHPLAGLFLLLGAAALARALEALRGKRPAAGLARLAVIGACLGLAAVEWIPYQPDLARWHYDRADSWLTAGETDKAVPEAEAMLREAYSPYMPFRLGLAFRAADRPALAARLLQAALDLDPAGQPAPYRQDLFFHTGAAQLAAGNLDAARAAFEEALRLNPRDVRTINDFGVLLEKAGDAEGARRRYEEAAALNPGFALPWTNLAEMASRAGDHEGAVRACGEAIARKPGEPAFHYNLARYLAAAGRRDDAIAEYRAVLELKPEDARAWNNLALLLAESGNTEGAERCYRKALEHAPDYILARANLGNLLMDTGRFAEGVAVYEEGVALDPANTELMNGLGWRHDLAGNADEALRWYGRALETAPRYARARLNRAGLLLRLGRPDEAERDAREAVAAAPDAPQTHHALGEILAARGDTAGARAAFTEALSLSPGFDPSRAALDSLPPAPAM